MGWGKVNKEQERIRQENRNRAKELQQHLADQYGIDYTPGYQQKEKIGKGEQRKLDAQYKRERQSGFSGSVRDYGKWNPNPRRTS
jgi:hypothetical protein